MSVKTEIKGSGAIAISGSGAVQMTVDLSAGDSIAFNQFAVSEINANTCKFKYAVDALARVVWAVFPAGSTITYSTILNGTGAEANNATDNVPANALQSVSIAGLTRATSYELAAYTRVGASGTRSIIKTRPFATTGTPETGGTVRVFDDQFDTQFA